MQATCDPDSKQINKQFSSNIKIQFKTESVCQTGPWVWRKLCHSFYRLILIGNFLCLFHSSVLISVNKLQEWLCPLIIKSSQCEKFLHEKLFQKEQKIVLFSLFLFAFSIFSYEIGIEPCLVSNKISLRIERNQLWLATRRKIEGERKGRCFKAC